MNYSAVQSYELESELLLKFYDTKQQEYNEFGYTIFAENDLPLSAKDWQQIEGEYKNLEYKTAEVAETHEATRVDYFRIKKSYLPEIYNQNIWQPLNTQEMYNLYKSTTGLQDPHIDRCQAHLYKTGNFLARHSDISVYKNYICTAVLVLNDDYEGGEFVIYNSEENPALLKPKPRSLILTKCNIDHCVNLITEGERKTICFFLTEGVCHDDGSLS